MDVAVWDGSCSRRHSYPYVSVHSWMRTKTASLVETGVQASGMPTPVAPCRQMNKMSRLERHMVSPTLDDPAADPAVVPINRISRCIFVAASVRPRGNLRRRIGHISAKLHSFVAFVFLAKFWRRIRLQKVYYGIGSYDWL